MRDVSQTVGFLFGSDSAKHHRPLAQPTYGIYVGSYGVDPLDVKLPMGGSVWLKALYKATKNQKDQKKNGMEKLHDCANTQVYKVSDCTGRMVAFRVSERDTQPGFVEVEDDNREKMELALYIRAHCRRFTPELYAACCVTKGGNDCSEEGGSRVFLSAQELFAESVLDVFHAAQREFDSTVERPTLARLDAVREGIVGALKCLVALNDRATPSFVHARVHAKHLLVREAGSSVAVIGLDPGFTFPVPVLSEDTILEAKAGMILWMALQVELYSLLEYEAGHDRIYLPKLFRSNGRGGLLLMTSNLGLALDEFDRYFERVASHPCLVGETRRVCTKAGDVGVAYRQRIQVLIQRIDVYGEAIRSSIPRLPLPLLPRSRAQR